MKDLATECLELPLFSESGLGVSMMPPVIPVGLKLFQRRSRGKRSVHPSCHGKYVFRYVLSGTIRIRVDDTDFRLKAGDAVLIAPCSRHEALGTDCLGQSLFAVFSTADREPRLLNVCNTVFTIRRQEKKFLTAAVDSFLRWNAGDPAAAEESVCYFALFLRQIQSQLEPGISEHKFHDRELPLLHRIVEYLAANRDHRVTLKELSRALHVSGSSIRQTFRKKMDRSIGKYELSRRLMYGHEMLKSTDLSVAEVAARCGFTSSNGFLRALKRAGCPSPREVRKRDYRQ